MTDDRDEQGYEQQWDDLSEKVILAQILTELQQIRLLLADADSAAQSDSDDAATYRCTECQTTVPADERESHARETHKAPPGMEDTLFEEVDGDG